jgi:hypothetical protein
MLPFRAEVYAHVLEVGASERYLRSTIGKTLTTLSDQSDLNDLSDRGDPRPAWAERTSDGGMNGG